VGSEEATNCPKTESCALGSLLFVGRLFVGCGVRGHEVLEGLELVVPVLPELVEPTREVIEGLRAKGVEADAAVPGDSPLDYEASFAKHSQMSAHCRAGDWKRLVEVTSRSGSVAEHFEDPSSRGVGEGGEQHVSGHLSIGYDIYHTR
jgi:hypothetical protein